jgi:hypothetical protein
LRLPWEIRTRFAGDLSKLDLVQAQAVSARLRAARPPA